MVQHLIANVMTRGHFDIAPKALAAKAGERFACFGVSAKVLSKDQFVLGVDGVELAVMLVRQPIPCEAFRLTDPNARDEHGPLVEHREHAVVATFREIKGHAATLRASLAALRVASVLAEEPGASALFFLPAETLTAAVAFRALMAPGSEQAELPISVLARVVALYGRGAGRDRPQGLAAIGFHRFIGRDIEFLPQPIAEGELLNRYANMGAWLLQQGLVFKDGDTCGLSAQEMIRVRYRDKGRISPNPILEFDVERLDAARPVVSVGSA